MGKKKSKLPLVLGIIFFVLTVLYKLDKELTQIKKDLAQKYSS